MKIIIKSKIIELTPAIEAFINEKIGSLGKFVKSCQKPDKTEIGKPNCELFMEIEKETKHHKKGPFFVAKTKLPLPGRTIVAVAENEDLRSAIVEVKDEMQQELKKYKGRMVEAKIRQQKKSKLEDIL